MPVQRLLNCFRGSCGFFWQSIIIYHFFAGRTFYRMFQQPLCSVYVACLALFSQMSLVQSLKFFDVSSLPFWQYTTLRKGMPTYANRPSSIYLLCVTLRTYLLQGFIALHRSAHSAYNARNVRVLIASSSICTTRSLLERCPHKNETLAAQRCYLRQKTRDHCAQPTQAYVRFLEVYKRILISNYGLLTLFFTP